MSKMNLDKMSFRKGVIGEDLDRCPDCTWDEDRIVEYCKPCAGSVDLMIAFLTSETAKAQKGNGT